MPGSITDTSAHTRDSLSPGSTIDQVISHEVKELGTHILVCEVTYHNAAGEKLNFRKFFKFQVKLVLDSYLGLFINNFPSSGYETARCED